MTITTTTLPQKGTATSSSSFSLPPEWINNEMKIARNIEHLQAAIVDVSRNLMQIITWSEMIQEDIDGMQNSISASTEEPEPEPESNPEEEDQNENETGTRTTKTRARLSIPPNPIL